MTIKDSLAVLHSETAHLREGMLHQVWEDGEVTLTKCGSLFGHRNVHTIELPFKKALPVSDFPCVNHTGTHGHINCASGDEAQLARELIHSVLFPIT